MASSIRYFPATVMGGRLHVSTGEGPWDSTRFDWWREDELDLILAGGSYGEKIRTREELEAALRAPTGIAPTRRVWIHESLEGNAGRLWEGSQGGDEGRGPGSEPSRSG